MRARRARRSAPQRLPVSAHKIYTVDISIYNGSSIQNKHIESLSNTVEIDNILYHIQNIYTVVICL